MPEMPEQIAQNLAHLELEARSPSIMSSIHSPPPSNMHNQQQYGPRHSSSNYGIASPAPEPALWAQRGASPRPNYVDEPSFSPFPVLKERKVNVPPTDEEKEDILEGAREAVLSSNDPEMQLAWAQDTLAFVEIAIQNERRLSKTRPPRPRTPRVEHQLRVDAVSIVDFLANQHHPKAEFLKGTWLEFGRFGHPIDKREAYRCYSRSAQAGYPRSEYRMGMQFESSNEWDKAIQHYNLGIQHGDAASNYRMGMMKLLGQCGQRQDFSQGIDMLKYSADNADENAPQGAYVFGMLSARELGEVSVPEQFLPLDIEVARVNIEKAAYLGFAKAQVKMGSAYELCELNCQFDPALSLHYSNLAARQGEPEAEMAISKWFLSGYDGIFGKDEGMAFAYAQRAAAEGLPTAEFAMGYFHEVGIHVPTSIKEARVWYSKAADHGNKDAAGRIDGISRSKTLSRKDHEKIAMAKINSTRRRGESQSHGGQISQPQIAMPAFPSAQDQYNQIYSQPTGGYHQGPAPNSGFAGRPRPAQGAGYHDQSYGNYPPAAQRPGNGYEGYEQPPKPSPGPGAYPQGPQNAPNYPPKPPINGPSPGPLGTYDRQYASSPPSSAPPPQNGVYGRPGLSPAPPMQPPMQAGGAQSYGPGSPHPPGANASGYRTGPGGLPANPAVGRMPAAPASPLPGLGFTAPPDPSGADRRKNPHRSDNPNPNPPGRGGYGLPGGPTGARPPINQTPSNASTPRPPRQESMRPPPGPMAPVAAPKPTPPPNNASTKPPPKPAQAAPARKPGKGPSTFEEMGVPQTKKEEDCIIM
ncbi:MAG: hypothetical protein MMC23_004914 [Stictis urceolatum]|nr:hypothetical protein [Stictis urceolata]